MAISRYWRLVGISTSGNGPLELSELRIYENGVLADASATLSATFAPTSGALADLRDGLTSDVVSWPYASYSTAGFALVWDFGVGAGVEYPICQMGSGSSKLTFPRDMLMQSSIDGLVWSLYAESVSVTYPGALMLTTMVAGYETYADSVALLLRGNGTDGSTAIADSSSPQKTIATFGNVQVSAAGGFSVGESIKFDGSGDYLTTPSNSDFDFGYANFTIDFWIKASLTTSGWVMVRRASSVDYAPFGILLTPGSNMRFVYANTDGQTYAIDVSGRGVLPANVWVHYAICRDDGRVIGYLHGAEDFNVAITGTMKPLAQPLAIGAGDAAGAAPNLSGYLANMRITPGVVRYKKAFVPRMLLGDPIVCDVQPASTTGHDSPLSEHLLPNIDFPASAAQGHLREHAFFDAYNGGIGIITGTVKEKNTPSNTPLYRRVLLLDERSQTAIRETWSDALTGDYEFRGVKQGVKYTVISYDHLHNYRAVIADNQDAT